MTSFSPEAQQLFDQYLQTVRWSVRGVADADEVERDVREHVSFALEQQEGPVSSQTLREVLSRLGDPWQWIAPEELPWWRRVLMRFALGPEDWRLAYACFALTLLGVVLLPVGIGFFMLIGAFLLARATYDLAKDRDGNLGARRWLVYPPLVVFSFFVAGALIIGPAPAVAAWGFGEHGFDQVRDLLAAQGWRTVDSVQLGIGFVVTAFGLWWIILSGLAAVLFVPLRAALVPFANRLRRIHLLWLTGIGVIVAAAGAAIFLKL